MAVEMLLIASSLPLTAVCISSRTRCKESASSCLICCCKVTESAVMAIPVAAMLCDCCCRGSRGPQLTPLAMALISARYSVQYIESILNSQGGSTMLGSSTSREFYNFVPETTLTSTHPTSVSPLLAAICGLVHSCTLHTLNEKHEVYHNRARVRTPEVGFLRETKRGLPYERRA